MPLCAAARVTRAAALRAGRAGASRSPAAPPPPWRWRQCRGAAADAAPAAAAEPAGDAEAAPQAAPVPKVQEDAHALRERLQRLREVQRRFEMDSPMEVQMRMGGYGKTTEETAPRYRKDKPWSLQRKHFEEQVTRIAKQPGVHIMRGARGEVRMIDVPMESMNKAEIDRMFSMSNRYVFFLNGFFVAFVIMLWLWLEQVVALVNHDAGPPPGEHIGAKVFLEIFQDENRVGTIVIGLYTKRCPLTCENFYRLCTADNADGLSYQNTDIFHIWRNLGICGGDYVKNNGAGGRPVLPYFPGKRWFPDEYGGKDLPFFTGCVASCGPLWSQKEGHNDSTFLISKRGTPKHNQSFVIFGEVLSGLEVVEHCCWQKSMGGYPIRRQWVKRCGRYTHTLEQRDKAATPGPAQFPIDMEKK